MKRGLRSLTSMATVAAPAVCCSGVASAATDGSGKPLAEYGNGTKWTTPRTTGPPAGEEPDLTGISCVQARTCTLAGALVGAG